MGLVDGGLCQNMALRGGIFLGSEKLTIIFITFSKRKHGPGIDDSM